MRPLTFYIYFKPSLPDKKIPNSSRIGDCKFYQYFSKLLQPNNCRGFKRFTRSQMNRIIECVCCFNANKSFVAIIR